MDSTLSFGIAMHALNIEKSIRSMDDNPNSRLY